MSGDGIAVTIGGVGLVLLVLVWLLAHRRHRSGFELDISLRHRTDDDAAPAPDDRPDPAP